MAKNINDLREHLFAALEGVKSGTMDIEKAKAISDISQTIINTAKVEVEFIKQTGSSGSSGFLDIRDETQPRLSKTIHRLAG